MSLDLDFDYTDLNKVNFEKYCKEVNFLKTFFRKNYQEYSEIADYIRYKSFFSSDNIFSITQSSNFFLENIDLSDLISKFFDHPGGKAKYRKDIIMSEETLRSCYLAKDHIIKTIDDFRKNYFKYFKQKTHFKQVLKPDYFLYAEGDNIIRGVQIEGLKFEITKFYIEMKYEVSSKKYRLSEFSTSSREILNKSNKFHHKFLRKFYPEEFI